MCEYRKLFFDDARGYVIQCLQCDHLQLAFGNIVMTLEKNEFFVFQQRIENYMEQPGCDQPAGIRSITVSTPCPGIRLLLSRAELAQLHSMLEAAGNELQALEMLSLFG